eukprot:11964849-Heterocapsa_arctica.AAC.1
MIRGYHRLNEERRTPGYMFDVVANSRYGWVPHGAISNWCKKLWKEVLTEQMFWHMILHTKSDKE